MTLLTSNKSLYIQDYALWLEETIRLLRSGQLEAIEANYLIEELTDRGISQKHALESNLIVLLFQTIDKNPPKYLNQLLLISFSLGIYHHLQKSADKIDYLKKKSYNYIIKKS
jgi:hypothetical protein